MNHHSDATRFANENASFPDMQQAQGPDLMHEKQKEYGLYAEAVQVLDQAGATREQMVRALTRRHIELKSPSGTNTIAQNFDVFCDAARFKFLRLQAEIAEMDDEKMAA